MNLTLISIVVRACSKAETKALELWTSSRLPRCQVWTATRGLQPPVDVLETLQRARFAGSSLSDTMFAPLITVSPEPEQYESNVIPDKKLADMATNLTHDLRQLQVSASQYTQQGSLSTSRDLRRFQRAMAKLQLTRIEIAASKAMLVTLFSPERMTLYIPHWFIDTLPQTVFEPNQSFYRARPASLSWLLLDAIVVTGANEFTTL